MNYLEELLARARIDVYELAEDSAPGSAIASYEQDKQAQHRIEEEQHDRTTTQATILAHPQHFLTKGKTSRVDIT